MVVAARVLILAGYGLMGCKWFLASDLFSPYRFQTASLVPCSAAVRHACTATNGLYSPSLRAGSTRINSFAIECALGITFRGAVASTSLYYFHCCMLMGTKLEMDIHQGGHADGESVGDHDGEFDGGGTPWRGRGSWHLVLPSVPHLL
jgi:hypothetical protein